VKVRIERAAFENHDGEVVTFLPEDLECGHNGTPRNSDRMTEAMTNVKLEVVAEALQLGLERGILTSSQKQELERAWEEHTRATARPFGMP
jgi:hypothetical protein